jgi:F-type H+-transporting ATPase subunit c
MKKFLLGIVIAPLVFFLSTAESFAIKVKNHAIIPKVSYQSRFLYHLLIHQLRGHYAVLFSNSIFFGLSVLGGALAIGLGVIGAGIGRGNASRGALNGMARNPKMEKSLVVWWITGMAIMESLALYALLITFILFFANPFKGIF